MYKMFLLSLICVLGLTEAEAQNKVRWMTLEEALAKSESSPRKIVIGAYINSCSWCKMMDKTTLAQDHIAKYFNENFYPVKLDSEYKSAITFKGVEYNYVRTLKGGHHELIAHLLNGKLSYPTLIFLDENQNVLQSITGYISAEDFELVLHYYGQDAYKTIPWRKFTCKYNMPVNKD